MDVLAGAGADFTLEIDPAEATVTPNNVPTLTFFVRPVNGFSGTVTVTIEGIDVPPAPLVVTQPPTPSQIVLAGSGGAGGTFVVRLADRPLYEPEPRQRLRHDDGIVVKQEAS